MLFPKIVIVIASLMQYSLLFILLQGNYGFFYFSLIIKTLLKLLLRSMENSKYSVKDINLIFSDSINLNL